MYMDGRALAHLRSRGDPKCREDEIQNGRMGGWEETRAGFHSPHRHQSPRRKRKSPPILAKAHLELLLQRRNIIIHHLAPRRPYPTPRRI